MRRSIPYFLFFLGKRGIGWGKGKIMEKNKLRISFALLILFLASTYLTNFIYWLIFIVLIIFYIVFKDAIMAINGEYKDNWNKMKQYLINNLLMVAIVVWFIFLCISNGLVFNYFGFKNIGSSSIDLGKIGDAFNIFNALVGAITIAGLYYNYQIMKEQIEQTKISQLNETINSLCVDILKEINLIKRKEFEQLNIYHNPNYTFEQSASLQIRYSGYYSKTLLTIDNCSIAFSFMFILIKSQVQTELEKGSFQMQGLNIMPPIYHHLFIQYMYEKYWITMLTYENGKTQIRKKEEIHEKIIRFILEEDGIGLFEKYNNKIDISIPYIDTAVGIQQQSFYNYVKSLAEKER